MTARRAFSALFFLSLGGAFVPTAEAAITYRYQHFLYTVAPATSWRAEREVWTLNGKPFVPPSSLLVDGDDVPALPPGVLRATEEAWNTDAIITSLSSSIGESVHREAGEVTIRRTDKGKIEFEGVGLTGRDIDLPLAAKLTVAALEQDVHDVALPVRETQPRIRVEDPELAAQGIEEVVTIGESNFSNSPANRRHNIAVGLSKFNGTLIPTGETFSFDETLGRVDASTGYLQELVIKGDRTVPDYGGGLCQVSTTAYRGVWEYGFPIVKRKNHSYTVSHYFPQGTDATVYPPSADMQFQNDLSGSLLIQTHSEGNLAYFIYYGKRDDRRSTLLGPYTWDQRAPPPDRTEYTTEIPPGEVKKLGERVPGVKAMWYRFLSRTGKDEVMEPVFSAYEARPHYELVGVASLPSATGSLLKTPPVMFMEDQPATAPLTPTVP